ncbi:MAG: hypothetical protein M1836_005470 [Candelina mexicana]|nr:MAG: hypothetical protein M1836_005470 [Candelina mexicana]
MAMLTLKQPEKVDSAWVRKLALNFEKRISKNAELRSKYEAEPQKFMGSEADLDADIKALSILSEHPELYTDFAKLGCVNSLVSLLAHENADIAIDVVEIISELTDEDVRAEQEQWDILVNAMLDADLLELLTSSFARFNENQESDRNGIYHALSVVENLSSQASISARIGEETQVITWLIDRAKKPEAPISQNKQYAAEVLAILLQSSLTNRKRFTDVDGVDIFLRLLSAYRKRDPLRGTEEEEYVENLFDCVTCIVDEAQGKHNFVEAEGVELCLIMLREGKMSKSRALRLVDHALGGPDGTKVCERMIEAAGLKTIFGMFSRKQDSETTEHLLGIFAALLGQLPGDSTGRIRTLAKFVEKDYEKIGKLVKLRRDYAQRVSDVDEAVKRERAGLTAKEQEDRADEWLSKRLDAGLFSLQTIDVILAWLVAEDDGARLRIKALLAARDESLAVIRATIQEQLDSMAASGDDQDGSEKDMLETLVGFF